MITTAAVYERDMKERLEALKHGTQLQAEKAVVETVEVLKQSDMRRERKYFRRSSIWRSKKT